MSTPNWIMVTVKTPQTAGDSYMANIMKLFSYLRIRRADRSHVANFLCTQKSIYILTIQKNNLLLFGWFADRYHHSGMIFQFPILIRLGQKKP